MKNTEPTIALYCQNCGHEEDFAPCNVNHGHAKSMVRCDKCGHVTKWTRIKPNSKTS